MHRFRELYRDDGAALEINTVVNALNRMEGVFCPNPGGAFYVMAQLPIDDSDKFCQWMLEKFSYQNQTVMMAPATGFYSTRGAGLNEVRLAYVLNNDDLLFIPCTSYPFFSKNSAKYAPSCPVMPVIKATFINNMV